MNDERSLHYAHTLSCLIQAETVSVEGSRDIEKFKKFHALLREEFPAFFGVVSVEEFDGSLLIRWKGKNNTEEKKEPFLLMSHHDVVEAPGEWKYPPFSGTIAEGKVWGRGTLDTKGSLWAMLQAAEELVSEGFVPDRDIYFESACTEETDGSGADRISRVLQERGIHFSMVLDEGGMILYDPIGGADGTFAVIGVGEKCSGDLKFVARSTGGHASTPGKNTPLVRLGKFMAVTEDAKLFDSQLPPVVQEMFERMAPYTKGAMRFLFSHAGALKGLLCRILPMVSGTAGAMLKTTMAFTMAHGSEGNNVLPQEAYVVANMRFSHHQGVENSIDAVRKLATKFDIETQVLDPGFESPVTDCHGEPFKLVERAVEAACPGVIPVPYIMMAASDSRFFSRVCDHCIRFAPFLISSEQMDSIHGINENVDISTLEQAVDFYKYIMREV